LVARGRLQLPRTHERIRQHEQHEQMQHEDPRYCCCLSRTSVLGCGAVFTTVIVLPSALRLVRLLRVPSVSHSVGLFMTSLPSATSLPPSSRYLNVPALRSVRITAFMCWPMPLTTKS